MTELRIRKGTLTAQVSEVPVKKHQRKVEAKAPSQQKMRRIELDELAPAAAMKLAFDQCAGRFNRRVEQKLLFRALVGC